jgi:erythronate-4-phosphate dehydrogenase
MKIIIDDKIPYIRGVLEPFAEVLYLPGNRTTADVARDADALITRTRTICSRELLEGSHVRLIATATIGFDHIDIDYCAQNGITWINAPGCNAESVNQYIASALFSYARRRDLGLKGLTVGMVGVGQVGSRIARTCEVLGMNVLLNDPPRARAEGPAQFVSLVQIQQQADIVSFHVPLNLEGRDKTWHMVNADFCAGLARKPLLINTCRGEVFDTPALHSALRAQWLSGLILDCWENEPGIDLELLDRVDFGTPHIAGYSKDGKAKGTQTAVRAVSRFFGLGIDDWTPSAVEPPANPVIELDGAGRSEESILSQAVMATYEIEQDDAALRRNPQLFEQLRGDYPVRREFDSYTVRASLVSPKTLKKLQLLGFKA